MRHPSLRMGEGDSFALILEVFTWVGEPDLSWALPALCPPAGGFWCWEIPREKTWKAELYWVPGDGKWYQTRVCRDTPFHLWLVLFS